MATFDKLVIITRKTQLDELIERFNSRDQARFYVEHMGASFAEYEAAHASYKQAVEHVREALPRSLRKQWIDRDFLPTFTFGNHDLVMTIGPDGLVVNTAKYLSDQPLVAINPDPSRIDGVLVPFHYGLTGEVVKSVLDGGHPIRRVTMACASLNDGQTLHAVNDLFIGQKTHVSARYRLRLPDREEAQSSSGIIVSTGAGSTGWYRSVLAGATGIVREVSGASSERDAQLLDHVRDGYPFNWEEERLVYCVREPFVSKVSQAAQVYGEITPDDPLVIVSEMPQNGVIFSDGIEADNIAFNSGAIATIGVADRKLHLVVSG